MKTKSFMGGLRIYGIGGFLKQAPYYFDIELKITGHDKGFLQETYYYEVDGPGTDKFNRHVQGLLNKMDK